jgi:hypothetical protein
MYCGASYRLILESLSMVAIVIQQAGTAVMSWRCNEHAASGEQI